MTPDIDQCPYDGTKLLEGFDVDENGGRSFFVCCDEDQHTFRSRWFGFAWVPDFDEVEV